MKATLLSFGLVLAVAMTAQAQPTMDGSIVGDELFYGAALSTQNTRTGFGDNTNPGPVDTESGGSELNQVFARIDSGRLYVMITGDLETNFNKLEVFIDSEAGGVNTIVGADLPQRVDGFCCGQTDPNETSGDGALQRMDGLTFDAGFTADHFLTFSNGDEDVGAGPRKFWAVNASYADLSAGNGTAGQPLGIQTAPRGLPQVLRNPMDYNNDDTVNAADYTLWRDSLTATGPGLAADGNSDEVIDQTDYDNWSANYGTDASTATGDEFLPSPDFPATAQLGKSILPGLSQGQLIDRSYALGAGGCTDDSGADCAAPELDFVLDVDTVNDPTNDNDHRNFNNTIDLELAFDNSNIDGVLGDGGNLSNLTPDPGEAESAETGIEFSLPLSSIGSTEGNGTDIRITAFINGTGHDFISNQFIGDGIEDLNLGGILFSTDPEPLTLADFVGDQFVTIANPMPSSSSIPEPTTALLMTLAVTGLGVVRRR